MSARTPLTYYPIGTQYDESGNDAHLCGGNENPVNVIAPLGCMCQL